ncbi:LIM domain-containing protein [Aphelenchoides avenae]|nr:LIM domain-containing protein [Aphelenchus avenae]
MFADNQQRSGEKCALCRKECSTADRTVVEKKTVHKDCFKCGYCGAALQLGSSAQDHSLVRFGIPWYYCPDHMHLPPDEKKKKLPKK